MSIKIDLKIFLFLLLFLLTSQLEMYILLMLFACLHELAHLCTGMILGFKVQEFKITPVGLQVGFKIKCDEYNEKVLKGNMLGIKKAIIAIAGPVFNFLISAILVKLKNVEGINLQQQIYQNIIFANILIGLFNLIPIYPLDGGRIVSEILHIFIGLNKSYKYTHIISKITVIILTVISSIAILYLQNISIFIIVSYLWIIVIKESLIYKTKKQINEIEENLYKQKQYCEIDNLYLREKSITLKN